MKIFVYGDSNTWGYFPTLDLYSGNDSDTLRYKDEDIWWYKLKEKNTLFINGNNGRTNGDDHILYDGKNAIKTINNDLSGIDNIDLTIIMLGTNDFKDIYHNTTESVINKMDKLIKVIYDKLKCEFLIICPPLIISNTKITELSYTNGEEKIRDYEIGLIEYCKKNKYHFVSAIDCEVGIDGEHLTISGHKKLGDIVNSYINKING